MRQFCLTEAINFGPRDYSSVTEDPQFRVGFEVEFVGVLKNIAQDLPKSSITVAYLLRSPQLVLDLFDIDWSSVQAVMQAWIHNTAQQHQSLLTATKEPRSILAAQDLYGSAAVKSLGHGKKDLIDFWQKNDWTTPEGRVAIQTKILENIWTPQLWFKELGSSIHDVNLRLIWPQIAAEPKFGWANEAHTAVYKDPEQKLTQSKIETLLVNQLNGLDLSSKVAYSSSKVNYELTYDGSINMDYRGSGEGFELISPPAPIEPSLNDLKKIFDWISRNGHYTNESTGFHVGVSYGEASSTRRVDRLKLILLLGEEHLLELFNRELNTYTQSHLLKLKKRISDAILKGQDWTKQRKFSDLLGKIDRQIDMSKYSTINFKKLDQGYIEFRIMGNEQYHERYQTVKDTILKYAFVLRAALDPQAYETTYKRELARLFGQALQTANPVYPDLVSKYAVLAASRSDNQLKNLDLFLRAKKAFEQGNKKVAAKILSILINQASKLSAKQNPSLINAAALSYRIFLKRHGLTITQFGRQMRAAKVKSEVIRPVLRYLRKF